MSNILAENVLFCRTCLSVAQDSLIQLDLHAINILKLCASVQVEDNEPFKLICRECHATLVDFNEFRLRCLNADEYVKSRVSVKKERLDIHGDVETHQNECVKVETCVKLENDRSDTCEPCEKYETDCQNVNDKINWSLLDVVKQQNDDTQRSKSTNESLSKFAASKLFVCIYCTKVFTDKTRFKSHGAREHPENNALVLKTCEFCRAEIHGTKALLKHMRVEHKGIGPTIPCDDCTGVFLVEEQKTHHILEEHSLQTCQVCGKNLIKGRASLINHLKRHARQYLTNTLANDLNGIDEQNLVNIECSLTEKKREILQISGASRTSTRTIQCTKCPKMFANLRQMKSHEFVHVKEKPFRCKECPKSFCQLNLLTTHVKQIHAAKPIYKCEQCHEAFYVELALTRHVNRVHFDPTCSHCPQTFTDYYKLRKHVKSAHVDALALRCDKCDRLFKHKSTFKVHMDRHNGTDLREICTVCGLKFLQLSIHMYTVHKIGQRTFKCRRCAETFDSRNAVRTHAKLHTRNVQPKQFECSACTKRFLLKINLDNHYTRTHGPERVVRFKCTLCDVEFPKKQRYEYHMRGHTGERPFVCEFCDRKFREMMQLTLHRRTHTGEKPHRCAVCDRRFIRSNTLAAHMKSHERMKRQI